MIIRTSCIVCSNPPKSYDGRGPHPKYCDSCDTSQQEKNTRKGRLIRAINKKKNALYSKILQGDYRPVIFKELSYEMNKSEKIKKGEKMYKSWDLHLFKIESVKKNGEDPIIIGDLVMNIPVERKIS